MMIHCVDYKKPVHDPKHLVCNLSDDVFDTGVATHLDRIYKN